MHTPLLVDTSTTFEEYLKRLSKPSKKKYKQAIKIQEPFKQIPYDSDLMWEYIRLWERQIVFGKHPKWCLAKSDMDKLNLTMFKIGDVAVHAIEVCGRYAYAHPPLYDKSYPIARFIWFNTIKWCCEHEIDYLDLGGLSGRDWPTLIRQRRNIKNLTYKWAFVPQDVKDNPDKEPRFYQLRCSCGWKQLGSPGDLCSRCVS